MSATARNLYPSGRQADDLMVVESEVSLPARDRMTLHLSVSQDGYIQEATLRGVGCPELLELMVKWRPLLQGRLEDVPLPSDAGHAAILLRELILRAQGKWQFPYKDEELCHCRSIATSKVDNAIIGGLRSVDAISRATSAGTSCGTCRTDIERILAYRLQGK